MEKYGRVSAEIMAILDTFSPLVEAVSVDEAFVDLTGTMACTQPLEAVRGSRPHRRENTPHRLGRARDNRFVAKVASELEKPDGLVVVGAGHEASFLAPLAIERSGVSGK